MAHAAGVPSASAAPEPALVLVSLAIGMIFARKFDVASDNYLYVALALGGLVTSRFDRWVSGVEPAAAAERQLGTSAEQSPAR